MQEAEKQNAQSLRLQISLVSPTGAYSVEGLVDDAMPMSLLIDTGAAVILIKKEV